MKKLLTLLQVFILLLAASCVALFIRVGAIGYISDSEIWAVTIASHLRTDWIHSWVVTRPLFYGILASTEAFAFDSASILQVAKGISLLNGLLILWLTYRLARQFTVRDEPIAPLLPGLALLILVSNSGFLNQGYRIRSDLLACSLVLLALERTIRSVRSQKVSGHEKLKLCGLWLLPMSATPKAVLQILPAVAFLTKLNP